MFSMLDSKSTVLGSSFGSRSYSPCTNLWPFGVCAEAGRVSSLAGTRLVPSRGVPSSPRHPGAPPRNDSTGISVQLTILIEYHNC